MPYPDILCSATRHLLIHYNNTPSWHHLLLSIYLLHPAVFAISVILLSLFLANCVQVNQVLTCYNLTKLIKANRLFAADNSHGSLAIFTLIIALFLVSVKI